MEPGWRRIFQWRRAKRHQVVSYYASPLLNFSSQSVSYSYKRMPLRLSASLPERAMSGRRAGYYIHPGSIPPCNRGFFSALLTMPPSIPISILTGKQDLRIGSIALTMPPRLRF